jgi:hypothetical protein
MTIADTWRRLLQTPPGPRRLPPGSRRRPPCATWAARGCTFRKMAELAAMAGRLPSALAVADRHRCRLLLSRFEEQPRPPELVVSLSGTGLPPRLHPAGYRPSHECGLECIVTLCLLAMVEPHHRKPPSILHAPEPGRERRWEGSPRGP